MSCCVFSTNASSASRSGVNHSPIQTSVAYFKPMCCLKCIRWTGQTKGFDLPVCGNKQGRQGARSSARFDADKSILDQIDPADGVASADLVQQFDQRNRIDFVPFTETGKPLSNPISTCSSRSGVSCGELVTAGTRRGRRGIFEYPALVADVPRLRSRL